MWKWPLFDKILPLIAFAKLVLTRTCGRFGEDCINDRKGIESFLKVNYLFNFEDCRWNGIFEQQ